MRHGRKQKCEEEKNQQGEEGKTRRKVRKGKPESKQEGQKRKEGKNVGAREVKNRQGARKSGERRKVQNMKQGGA